MGPIAPNPTSVLPTYTVSRSLDGGFNYFYGSNPVTREAYAAGTGLAAQNDPTALSTSTQNTTPPPPNPNGGTGTKYEDKSGDIALQNAGLAEEPNKTNIGISGVDKALASLKGDYANETAGNEATYNDRSNSNQNSLQKNKETSLVNAAQGRRGLFGTLSALGALNGSGIELANNAVANGANADLSAAGDNYASNATMLDDSIGKYRKEDKTRNDNAVVAADNAKGNIRNDAAKSKQSFYTNLANDYTAQGDKAQAAGYAGKAAGMYPEISATSLPGGGPVHADAAFTPTSLANYIAGANNTQVTATPRTGIGASQLPGLVADNTKRKTA